MGGLGVWLGLCDLPCSISKTEKRRADAYCTCVQHDPCTKRSIYQVYFVDVLRHASPFEFPIGVVRRDGRVEGGATGHVQVRVREEGRRPSGLHV